jgi:pilus assembly protein CpaD
MWWTDRRALRAPVSLVALAAVGALGACTTPLGPDRAATPLTPTEQYTVQVEQAPDQLALAPHAEGLSANQNAAVAGFVARWRESGRAEIAIQTPADGDPSAVDRTASGLLNLLLGAGVPGEKVRVAPYDAAGIPGAPILASFLRYEARGPNCQGGWDNLSATKDNNPTSHFGCANTANFAAMVADPRDLISPRVSEPGDAARRGVVLGKYRNGEPTSTARDSQAVGAVSSAVN